ncbi:MAG: tetratricopeptide repeat protein, partial [Planctomycetia bacterium]|nr:tetratricopeptide repeat protein [Planctomycetia bacterium]
EPGPQAELADEYWKLAEAEKVAPAKKNLYLRAKEWYEQAATSASGTVKANADKRVKSIEATLAKDEINLGERQPTNPGTAPQLSVKQQYEKAMSAGRTAGQKGKYQEAKESFEKALELVPNDAKAEFARKQAAYLMHMQNGQIAFQKGELKQAYQAFERALEELPEDVAAKLAKNRVKERYFMRDREREKN